MRQAMLKHRISSIAILLTILLIFAGSTAACGGQATQEITIRMSEYAFDSNQIRFEAGSNVRLTLINDGIIEHEFLILKNADSEAPTDFFDRDASNVQVIEGDRFSVGTPEDIEEEGWHVEIEPEGRVVMEFDVPKEKAGDWEMACFIDIGDTTHYHLGMQGNIDISE